MLCTLVFWLGQKLKFSALKYMYSVNPHTCICYSVLTKVLKGLKSIFPFLRPYQVLNLDILFEVLKDQNIGIMSLHVVKKIVAPGKGSEISHLIS